MLKFLRLFLILTGILAMLALPVSAAEATAANGPGTAFFFQPEEDDPASMTDDHSPNDTDEIQPLQDPPSRQNNSPATGSTSLRGIFGWLFLLSGCAISVCLLQILRWKQK